MKLRGMLFAVILCTAMLFSGCNGRIECTDDSSVNATPATEQHTTEEPVTEAPTTEEPTTEEPTTEEPTTEEPTEPYVSTFSLLQGEELHPSKTGYTELDGLIEELFATIITDDMSNYKKVWASYEYLVDNITYSRGMDANTGAYSQSDPAVTPREILWASDLLNSGQGCCYNYSAAFAFIMRAIGYDATIVSGNVPAYAGGVTPHCWVVVNLAGDQYTFDPDLDMNFYTRGDSETKDVWFGRKYEEVKYFYQAVTYHEI